MPRKRYIEKNFSTESLKIIQTADQICEEYADEGFDLTLRQLYYQFVSRDLLSNSEQSYKRLGSIINDARLAGLIDWDHMVDRTRNAEINGHWDNIADVIESAMYSFQLDKWGGQELRVEVWIEKEALVGVIDQVCRNLDILFFACRGYVSQSEMWRAAQRINRYDCDRVIILHLGDHDPSGIDMTRDITDRLSLFYANCDVKRIALNMNQIDFYNPPPNPAKISDSRSHEYIKKYGDKSWELDALKPETIIELIKDTVEGYRDNDLYFELADQEQEHIKSLKIIAESFKR